MERFGSGAWIEEDGNHPSLAGLVELIVAISDETDDAWEIDDRVAGVMRGGRVDRFD
jgi:hypothetical protein